MSEIRLANGNRLTIDREVIEVTSISSQPDPKWRFIDAAGHRHRYNTSKNPYPTLRDITETYWCPDCRDEHTDLIRRECIWCKEVIVPGEKPPSPFPEYIPGPTTYRLNGQIISEEEAQAIFNDAISNLGL